MFHASAIINLHREGLIAVPTFRSLEAARLAARAVGFDVEFVAVLDNADAQTRRVVEEWAQCFEQIHHVEFGDLGAARAFGIDAAQADWVFMHDADDLFSTNWYVAFLTMLAEGRADERTVYHTDLFARFGEEIDVRKMINSTDARFHPLFMASEWYYSNKAVFHRRLLNQFPMPFNNRRTGIGNEDWTWASHTIAGGIRHLTIPGTACFYRAKNANVSLGLTPGMIHDASPLYDPDSVISMAVKLAERQSRLRNFSPVLAGRADGVLGEGPISHWFWDEVQAQSDYESEISEFLAHRTTMQCYLPHLHFNVVSAVEYLMRDLDSRPKIFIFATAANMRAPDILLDLVLRSAAALDNEAYQPVLILDEGALVPSDLRALATYGAKIIAVDHMRRYFKIEDWYFERLLMRPIVQFKGSILLDICADNFAALFAQFHRVMIENFQPLVTILPDRVVDLLSPATANLFANARAYCAHRRAPLPVLCHSALQPYLEQSGQLLPVPLPTAQEGCIEQALTLRYRQVNDEALTLDLASLRSAIASGPAAMPTEVAQEVICTKIEADGQTFVQYSTSQSWADKRWPELAARFLAKNPHLHICAPQISLARHGSGAPEARWHNFSDAQGNFTATYEQLLGGAQVPIVVLLRQELPDPAPGSTLELSRALVRFCRDTPDCKASAHGESVAIFTPGRAHASPNLPPATPLEADIYWQGYEDLAALFARGIWGPAELQAHFRDHGRREGRRIPAPAEAPKFWSDRLYFEGATDGYRWWWDRGVLQTGLWRALVAPDKIVNHGNIPLNERLQRASAMHAGTIGLLAEFDQGHPGEGYLHDIYAGKLGWREHRQSGLMALLDAAAEMASAQDVILVPSLDSGGAELVGLWHYRAACAAGRKPLVILTDKDVVTPRFAAEGMAILSMPQIIGVESYMRLTVDQRAQMLADILDVLKPESLQLIHAFTGYRALKTPGLATRIRAACGRIYVSTFCPHIHPDGRKDGYFRDIPAISPLVDRFIFDNTWFADEMRKSYQIDERQIAVVYYPVEPFIQRPGTGRNPQDVLWASRFDAQKNPQIVAEIARRMPDVTFHLFGRAVLGDTSLDWSKMPQNVRNSGPFFGVDCLPVSDMGAFLYTSRFDGMPNILLEIAAHGVPIVTPAVGGVPDFLGEDWPLTVSGPDDVDSYVAALERVLQSPALHADCVASQYERLNSQRSLTAFYAQAAQFYGSGGA